jgi:acarbose 7IV-phosphotransferase
LYTPVAYTPFRIASTISAVGYNIIKALSTLGAEVAFASIIGDDDNGSHIINTLMHGGINARYILPLAEATAQSVLLYDTSGKRVVITDLKNIPACQYPIELFQEAIKESDLVVLTNIAYCKNLLPSTHQKIVATDVQSITSWQEEYNAPFMRRADILFMSGEVLQDGVDETITLIFSNYPTQIIVVGLGERGAYLAVRNTNKRVLVPAVHTRPVVNSGGAGDALFSAFLYFYLETQDPMFALKRAVIFASYKIGAVSSGEGFLTRVQLEELVASLNNSI